MTDDMIGYVSDCAADYTIDLEAVESLDDLRVVVSRWSLLVSDARRVVDAMTDADWQPYLEACIEKRKEQEPSVNCQRFSPVFMPEILFQVAMFAAQYKVPWGTMYRRLRDVGKINVGSGFAVLVP